MHIGDKLIKYFSPSIVFRKETPSRQRWAQGGMVRCTPFVNLHPPTLKKLYVMNADGKTLFRTFLSREFADENLNFIIKVNEYRECDLKERPKLAWKIYKTFIAIGSPHEVNLDTMSRRVTELAMITPHLSTFDAAQKRIKNMLENDAYKRFLDWKIYKDICKPPNVEKKEQETSL